MKIKKFWEANFLNMELLLSLFLSGGFIIWSEFVNGGQLLFYFLSDNRTALYGSLSAFFGTMFGFIITAVSIVLGYATSEKLAIIRQSKYYEDLWKVFKDAIRVLGLATIFSLVGLIFDKNNSTTNFYLYLNFFSSTLSFFRIARCIWVIENIITVVTKKH